jgi:hypothetical protein
MPVRAVLGRDDAIGDGPTAAVPTCALRVDGARDTAACRERVLNLPDDGLRD